MPGGDGLTFARAARELFPTLPIVLVSGHPVSERISFELVKKPFLPDALLTAVQRATNCGGLTAAM